ncbi:MAG: sigma-70 family RNA polymerase sigma factor [Actinomycetota bacterium]
MDSLYSVNEAAARFDAFVRDRGRHLTRALVAAYGPTDGAEAAQSALCYAWEHWARVESMSNPSGYLYRVGQTAARDLRRQRRPIGHGRIADLAASGDVVFEPGLVDALVALTESQRIAVVLVHGHGYRLIEVAAVLDVSVSTLRNHLRRGLDKLRVSLGAEHVNA